MENWAAAGFWKQLVAGLDAFKKREQKDLPLAFFTAGTRMLPMTTVGILFYVTPSLQFLCGVWLLGEPFDTDRLIGFIGIWTGLAIFTWDLLSRQQSHQND